MALRKSLTCICRQSIDELLRLGLDSFGLQQQSIYASCLHNVGVERALQLVHDPGNVLRCYLIAKHHSHLCVKERFDMNATWKRQKLAREFELVRDGGSQGFDCVHGSRQRPVPQSCLCDCLHGFELIHDAIWNHTTQLRNHHSQELMELLGVLFGPQQRCEHAEQQFILAFQELLRGEIQCM